jgi:D-arabinose 1-dehydrogenase-like Zn-dependent alcohol dehydrogenase
VGYFCRRKFLKATVYMGPHDIRIEDVHELRVSGRKVLVKFKAGGICGTDINFHGGDRRWMKLGLIIGHDA